MVKKFLKPYRLQHAEAWYWLYLNMKDRVKSTKNKISIISWKTIPFQDLNLRPPTPQSAALPSVLSHHINIHAGLYGNQTWFLQKNSLVCHNNDKTAYANALMEFLSCQITGAEIQWALQSKFFHFAEFYIEKGQVKNDKRIMVSARNEAFAS